MDPGTFDLFSRYAAQRRPRRAALGALAALAGALIVALDAPMGSRAKKKKKSPKVTLCLDGQSITVKKKQRNGYIRQGATAGRCAPDAGGPAPAPNGCGSGPACDPCLLETCQNGACACPAGAFRDATNVCGAPPSCYPVGAAVQTASQCCSNSAVPYVNNTVMCRPGQDRCLSTGDCAGGPCLGYLCPGRYLQLAGSQCTTKSGCPSSVACGNDRNGQCSCGPDGVCASSVAQIVIASGGGWDDCPDTTAQFGEVAGFATCYPPCGQPFACCSGAGSRCGNGMCSY